VRQAVRDEVRDPVQDRSQLVPPGALEDFWQVLLDHIEERQGGLEDRSRQHQLVSLRQRHCHGHLQQHPVLAPEVVLYRGIDHRLHRLLLLHEPPVEPLFGLWCPLELAADLPEELPPFLQAGEGGLLLVGELRSWNGSAGDGGTDEDAPAAEPAGDDL